MITWWNSLSSMMQVLWAITLSATLISIIQTILTFLGVGGEGGIDADVSGDVDLGGADGSFDADPSMNLLTFRNFVNFILGFGWSAILLQDSVPSVPLRIILSVIIGIALVAAVMYLFKWLAGMQQSGNINLQKSAAGCEGKVYLTIPEGRSGTGKVQITINGAVREYDALTESETPLKTGTSIRVVDALDANTLLVEETNTYTV